LPACAQCIPGEDSLKARGLPGSADFLAWNNDRTTVGQIAEMLTGNDDQLVFREAAVIESFDANNPIDQVAVVTLKVLQQQRQHVIGAIAVTQQQDDIGIGDRCRAASEVVMIDGGSLASLIAFMAMAEILIRSPDAVGLEHGMVHLFSLKAEHIGVAMVEQQNQSTALIAPGGGSVSLRMIRPDAGLLKQMAQAHHRFCIQIGIPQATAGADPGFLSCGLCRRRRRSQSSVTLAARERVGVESLKRAQLVAFHGRTSRFQGLN